MKYVLWVLGWIWMLPMVLIGFGIALFGGATLYRVRSDRYWTRHYEITKGGLLDRFMQNGAGPGNSFAGVTCGPCVFSIVDYLEQPRHVAHECRHVWQQMVGGVFQPITYGLFYLWLRAKGMKHFDAYYAIPWEQDARAAAEKEVS